MTRSIEQDLARARGRSTQPSDTLLARFARGALERGLVDVAYALVDSPLGRLLLAATERGLVRVSFESDRLDTVLADLGARVSPRVMEAPARLEPIRRQLDEYFDGSRTTFEVDVDSRVAGPFARRVLAVTAKIPHGRTSTYSEVAARAGSPLAVRAAGNALGANPIAIVIPCHRVLRLDGTLGGYAGGLERKRFLLELERGRAAS